MLVKKNDWQILFYDFIEKNRFKPFKWGTWDCCKFSNACIKAMTGEDLIPKELKWKNEEEALESIKNYGGTLSNSIKKACKLKGLVEIDKNHMQLGDLVVYKEETELAGIFDGSLVLTPQDEILSAKSNVNVVAVWRING